MSSELMMPTCLLLVLLVVSATTDEAVAPIQQVEVMSTGMGGYAAFRIPGMVALKHNNLTHTATATPSANHNRTLLIFAEGRKYGCSDFAGQHDMICRRSTDGGQSFSNCSSSGMAIVDAGKLWPTDSGAKGAGVWDPTPVEDSTTGEVFLFFSVSLAAFNSEDYLGKVPWGNSLFMMSSTDAGASWSAPRNMTQLDASPEKTGSAPWGRWCGQTAGGGNGVQLSSGRLLVPGYHTDCGPKIVGHTNKRGGHETWSHVVYSDTHGRSWKKTEQFGLMTAEGALAIVPDGTTEHSSAPLPTSHRQPAAQQHLRYSFRTDLSPWNSTMHCSPAQPSGGPLAPASGQRCRRTATSTDGGLTVRSLTYMLFRIYLFRAIYGWRPSTYIHLSLCGSS
eukprot:COSAG01_NODE_3007_length_6730_cov_10.756899_11_plen_392_part_00